MLIAINKNKSKVIKDRYGVVLEICSSNQEDDNISKLDYLKYRSLYGCALVLYDMDSETFHNTYGDWIDIIID